MRTRFEDAQEEQEQVRKKPTRAKDRAPRKFRINVSDMQRHGYTEACPQCRYVEQYHRTNDKLEHTEMCRARLIDRIMTTPGGRARLEAHEKEIDKYLAERVEEGDTSRDREAPGGDDAVAAEGPGGCLEPDFDDEISHIMLRAHLDLRNAARLRHVWDE